MWNNCIIMVIISVTFELLRYLIVKLTMKTG